MKKTAKYFITLSGDATVQKFAEYTAVSDLIVSMPQSGQFSTQICFLLLQGHHCKKTQ